MKYRAEIDGLRALAVVPVILFHAGFELFSGGFVGVDVFFVISGYLITTILIEDIENDRFSILKFYEKRARRILPALALVCFSTLPFSYFYLDPNSFADYGKSLTSVSVFLSNVYFALSGGYFAEYVSTKPLLHTWSLSVEEQFYIVFPFVVLLSAGHSRIKLVSTITILTVISFICALVLVDVYPRIAFFGIPTRAWELGIGALLAASRDSWANLNKVYGNILGVLGISLLIASYLLISADNEMPGLVALIPVLGTALIIIVPHSSLSTKILGNKIFVGIGLISYSLYLWHQPVLSFGHQISKSLLATLLLLSIILALSLLSWKYVETPFRSKKFVKDSYVLPFSMAALIVLGLTGWFVSSNNGFDERFPVYKTYLSQTKWSDDKNVDAACADQYGGDQYCLINDLSSDVTDVLIGDSHANHFYHGLAERLREVDRNLLMIGAGGCPPLIDIDMGFNYIHGSRLGCLDRVNEEYLSILSAPTVQNVYLAFAQETMFDERLDFVDYSEEIDFSQNRNDAVFAAVMRTVSYAQRNGKLVSILMDLPDTTHADFTRCLLQRNSETECLSVWVVEEQNEEYMRLLNRLREEGVTVIDTSFALDNFPFTAHQSYLYRDGTHLSSDGSHFVASKIILP
jgi:peptidoglycan/LPS O-acetylase OafA/YrhL